MKQKINPAVAIGVIVAIIALVAGAMFMKGSRVAAEDTAKPPPIPADAAEKLKTIMGNMSRKPGGGGTTAPPSTGGGGQ